jgi:hypothetical protein
MSFSFKTGWERATEAKQALTPGEQQRILHADVVWFPMTFVSVLLEISMRSNRTVRLTGAKLIIHGLGLLGFCTGIGCAAVAQQAEQSSTADRPKTAYAVEG